MKLTKSVFVVILIQLLVIATNDISFCYGSSHSRIGCIASERQALLRFKKDLKDSSNRLASWTGHGDCCSWAGVICNNLTGHVLQLHLRNPLNQIDFLHKSEAEIEAYESSRFGGKINPSLLDLKQLIYLDLSFNDFGGIEIPKFLGSMKNLQNLNLSNAGFGGMIPHQIGNLSNLQHLDFSNNKLQAESLHWLSGLSLLTHLDLSQVDLSKAPDWLSVINPLPSLEVLQLALCNILHLPPLPIANFSSLSTLDLSFNNFDNSFIPNWVFTLSDHLVHLDLRHNNFEGSIPNGLQNLTSLRYLDLSSNSFNHSIPSWLYKFSFLEFLSLQRNNFVGPIPHSLGSLTSIKVIFLSSNKMLQGRIPRSFGRLCNLRSISLMDVNVSQDLSEILDIFSGCVSNKLEVLNMETSQLYGIFTNQFGKFQNLKNLNLFNNSISGPIPFSLGELSSLVHLDLSRNKLNGSIPLSLGKLSSLEYLDISHNELNGTLFPIHLVNLTRLSIFSISGNSLLMKVPHDWVPPFQLQKFGLRSCQVGHQFPSWLLSQNVLQHLDISNSGILDTVPSRFWKSFSRFNYLNLSNNKIYGELPDLSESVQLEYLDLSSNNLSGPLPRISSIAFEVDLSNNALSGSISHFLSCGINVSKKFRFLSLENNSLSGEIPNCWTDWMYLQVLNLNNNGFSGELPASIGNLSSLVTLHVCKNRLSGVIPLSLKSCTNLQVLDIGVNEFVGNVPTWIGEGLPKLNYLNLRSNQFHGPLPAELCRLASLRILDVAYNNLFGTIPRCINNFSEMRVIREYEHSKYIDYADGRDIEDRIDYVGSLENALLVMKGKMVKYNTILNLLRMIDLSNNKFSGEIPKEMTNLGALQSLNLSQNFFTGRIPKKIGDMKSLESMDLSANRLFGEIPQSITGLTFLSWLNLSNNNLTGEIPLSTQLQSFDPSSFMGNDLCGAPLRDCNETIPTPPIKNGGGKDGNRHEMNWFYVSMALGFVVGFWIIVGPLVLNRRWRYKYYHFLDCLLKKLAVL